jgi:hypothetical protein
MRPTVICLTPVKNESWILEKFLMAASLWADHIIIADQFSDDGSREIAARFPKVTLIRNSSTTYHESERQKLLIEAARKIEGSRLLFTLDSDEFLTANFQESPEWDLIMQASPGTIIRFNRVNLRSDFVKYWSSGWYYPWGFMDDGTEHVGTIIHSARIPLPMSSMKIDLKEIKVLHFQYADWERVASKHRWYQCWETLNRPERSAAEIYRQYHHMYNVRPEDLFDVEKEWFDFYFQRNIDIKEVKKDEAYWLDREVLEYFHRYGTSRFKKLDIWNTDWQRKSRYFNIDLSGANFEPRGPIDKLIHAWLRTESINGPPIIREILNRTLKLSHW